VPSFVLVGVAGKVRDQRWPVPAEGLGVGRQRGNGLRIDDTGVSRQHARFVLLQDALWVQDLGSRNGIFVNGTRVVGQRRIADGDRVMLGDHVLEIRSGEPARPRNWRLWPFLLLGTAVLILAVTIVASRPDRIRIAAPAPADPVADLLRSTSGPLAPSPASSAPPPEGASPAELVDLGHQQYEAGRLHEALVAYRQAQALDPACEICALRVGRLRGEIAQAITVRMAEGLRAFTDLRYDQAVLAWEAVLLLDPDPESQVHQEASAYLQEARARLQGGE
jgi:hypothetical protein